MKLFTWIPALLVICSTPALAVELVHNGALLRAKPIRATYSLDEEDRKATDELTEVNLVVSPKMFFVHPYGLATSYFGVTGIIPGTNVECVEKADITFTCHGALKRKGMSLYIVISNSLDRVERTPIEVATVQPNGKVTFLDNVTPKAVHLEFENYEANSVDFSLHLN